MSGKKVTAELSDVIAGLRDELESAQKKGVHRDIRFGVESIELEMEVSILKAAEGSAGSQAKMQSAGILKYFIGDVEGDVTLSGSGKYEKVGKQKLKLTLSANGADGSKTLLSNTDDDRD